MRTKRLFYQIVNPFRWAYWFVFRPRTRGVKIVIENRGKLLMVRNTYGHKQWTFPGGGVNWGETPEAAARREAFEEVGIHLTELVPIGEYESRRHYKRDRVWCFYAEVLTDQFVIDDDEIAEAAWFSRDEVPSAHAAAVDQISALLLARGTLA